MIKSMQQYGFWHGLSKILEPGILCICLDPWGYFGLTFPVILTHMKNPKWIYPTVQIN